LVVSKQENMNNFVFLLLFSGSLILLHGFHRTVWPAESNENRANLDSIQINRQFVSILFWNVENLYDPLNDSLTLDDEFTREGMKKWSMSRVMRKINHVAKTLMAAGGWEPLSIVGLCEIENRQVLEWLVNRSILRSRNLKIIHFDSPDPRGVDAALLYNPLIFTPLHSKPISVRFPFDTLAKTRDILMVKGVLARIDTLYLFVNHWPSRRGGQAQSLPRRMTAGRILRHVVDSLFSKTNQAHIVIMGDFNDEPEDASINETLGAQICQHEWKSQELYNLMGIRNLRYREGTLKFRDQWSTFDQFIVSGSLLNASSALVSGPEYVTIIREGFLMEEDSRYFGNKLRRTYAGPQYLGGFSDHLPIRIRIKLKK
jgi:hypothetical protein